MEEYLQYIGGVVGAAAVTGAAAMATSMYMATLPPPFDPIIDIDNQSTELPGPERIRISRLCKDGKLVKYIYEDAKTLLEALYRGAKVSKNGPCLGWREGKESPYQWISYNELLVRIRKFGSGLVHTGMTPGQSSFIGIYAQNCIEWVVAEYACYHHVGVVVPLYDTLGPNACSYIINQADIRTVICDKEEKARALLSEASRTPRLKQIIMIRDVSDDIKIAAKSHGIELFSFKEIEEIGKNNLKDVMSPKPNDFATVCYTSGTTGNPKGVLLTHGQIISSVSSVLLMLGDHAPTHEDIMISYLPLAHMFERACEVVAFTVGGSIGFFQGDIRLLTDDIKTLRPTFVPAVPRLLNRIYDKVLSSLSGHKVKKWLFDMAIQSKHAELERHIISNRSVWDKTVFKPVQESLGGRVRILVTGSAPLASNVLTFLRCSLGCIVVEGYGQTECVAPCTSTIPGDFSVGHVGPPLPSCAIKLVDVPDMDYYAVNDQGEICVKGLNVFSGYLKDPEKTAETIDKNGWLHTGDIGMWLRSGALRIIDRKKNIFKLAQGEYIAPEKIENIYLESPFVAQILVHGESLQACLVGIVIPDKGPVLNWCEENNVSGDWHKLLENKDLKQAILNDITVLGKKGGLKSFEQVKDIYLHPDPFSVENGLMTPTMKTRRPECRKFFMPQIEAMYKVLNS